MAPSRPRGPERLPAPRSSGALLVHLVRLRARRRPCARPAMTGHQLGLAGRRRHRIGIARRLHDHPKAYNHRLAANCGRARVDRRRRESGAGSSLLLRRPPCIGWDMVTDTPTALLRCASRCRRPFEDLVRKSRLRVCALSSNDAAAGPVTESAGGKPSGLFDCLDGQSPVTRKATGGRPKPSRACGSPRHRPAAGTCRARDEPPAAAPCVGSE